MSDRLNGTALKGRVGPQDLLSSAYQPAGADIFVGGFLDHIKTPVSGHVVKGYAERHRRQVLHPVEYHRTGEIDRVVDTIRRANRAGGPVNVVGHSWGGPDAYSAVVQARAQGLRVDNLVTVDPVSRPGENIGRLPAGQRWVNVEGVPRKRELSDLITNIPLVSRKPSRLPIARATKTVRIEASHADFERMMRLGGGQEQLASSRKASSASTDATADAGRPDDALPAREWMLERLRRLGPQIERVKRR
jgi:thioesterase domain-containing protein